jgi:hypothetical protein
MNPLKQKTLLFSIALFLAIILSLSVSPTIHVCATCGSTMHYVRSERTDRQTSDTKNGVTTETEKTTDRTVIVGDRGDVYTHSSTVNKNADGSSSEQEDYHLEDPDGCYAAGEPWKGDLSRGDTKDPNGNRKRHQEEFFEKDGKCIKTVRDWEWNAKGELIKDTGWITTEVPCLRTSLEVRWGGELTSGVLSVIWGPETSVVPLTVKDKRYTGQFTGEWKGKLTTDACNCSATFPVTIDVKGLEDEFEIIEFTVTINRGAMANCMCLGKSGSGGEIPKPEIYNFKLPAQGGATVTMDEANGAVKTKTTFTLKMK